MEKVRLIIGSTGGSGVGYLLRMFFHLLDIPGETTWIASENFFRVCESEMDKDFSALQNGNIEKTILDLYRDEFAEKNIEIKHKFKIEEYRDIAAAASSGSVHYDAMVVLPCSMKTLAAIAGGLSSNLIERAADVSLKERRKIILVLRETPYSLIHIENMKKVTQAGAVVMPASPGFYHNPRSITEIYDFMVDRIFMHLQISKRVMEPWKNPGKAE